MKLVLRGHHLLCLQGFQGYGYDADFVENIAEINAKRKSENATVTLTDEADDICGSCPNLKNNLCKNPKQNKIITSMDNEVLSKFDISKEYNAVDLFKQIEKHFNSRETVENICSNCIWHEKCLFYQKL